jgi:protein TonB
MFETSVIQTPAKASGGRLSLLTVSVIAHTAVIIGAVAVSVASVDFPKTAPDEFTQAPLFATVQIPPPLGNPNGGARPEQPRPATPPPAPPTNQVTAPSVVPDDVPHLDAPSNGDSNTTGDPNATVAGPIGVPWGDPNSLGDPNAPPPLNTTTVAAQPDKIYEAYEVKAPVALFKPAPPYPQVLIKTKMPATVVVRCVIDKNGRVRDPQVVLAARMSPFNDAVLNAVKQWRFTPGSLNGQAVETYLSLTVNFAVN